MEQLMELDRGWFLQLNGLHSAWLDPIMYWLTQTWIWLPLYAFMLFLIIRTYGKDSWIVLVGVTLTILIADRVTSGLMKPYFARLRPTHDPTLESLVHIVNGYRGGKYGFASGHAANTFGVALYFWITLRKTHRWMPLIFCWAALMTYTRIYLGVHYPGDILVGAAVGMTGALISFVVCRLLHSRFGSELPYPRLS